jgi:hypothetical protein
MVVQASAVLSKVAGCFLLHHVQDPHGDWLFVRLGHEVEMSPSSLSVLVEVTHAPEGSP